MNRSHWLWVLSVITILAMVLAGCAQPTSEEKPGEEATPVAAEEKVTLTVWDFGGSEFSWMDDPAIPAFQEKFPNIEINHVGIPEEEISLKLETAIAAKEVPDVVVFPSARLAKAGHILPLNDYLERDGISTDDYCGLFEAWNMLGDEVIGLPIDTNVMLTVFNKDLFDEAGITAPGPEDYITYDDWLEYARAVNKPAASLDERVWGATFLWPPYNAMFHYQSDPYVLGDDGRSCVGNADTEEWIHVWEVLLTAYDEDLTTETGGTLLADVEQDVFVLGKLGMTWGALGDALHAKQQGINVGITGSAMVTPGWVNNVGGWTTSYGIMSATEHPDEAWEFVKWLSVEAPKIIPIGSDALAEGGGGLPGLPCYNPLMQDERFVQMAEEEPFVAIAIKLADRARSAPYSPDLWTVTEPFFEAFRRMSEDRVDVETAVKEAAQQCQELLDEMWADFDSLGQ